eukprot:Rhum_TRINITY_DN20716_c0_g1::Rhum_TRINITY_DN20716_c0_g1_i1::g.172189::m.172189
MGGVSKVREEKSVWVYVVRSESLCLVVCDARRSELTLRHSRFQPLENLAPVVDLHGSVRVTSARIKVLRKDGSDPLVPSLEVVRAFACLELVHPLVRVTNLLLTRNFGNLEGTGTQALGEQDFVDELHFEVLLAVLVHVAVYQEGKIPRPAVPLKCEAPRDYRRHERELLHHFRAHVAQTPLAAHARDAAVQLQLLTQLLVDGTPCSAAGDSVRAQGLGGVEGAQEPVARERLCNSLCEHEDAQHNLNDVRVERDEVHVGRRMDALVPVLHVYHQEGEPLLRQRQRHTLTLLARHSGVKPG